MLPSKTILLYLPFGPAASTGLEPAAFDFGDRYSTIELRSYLSLQSIREDLNLRPLAPEASALPGCATDRFGN